MGFDVLDAIDVSAVGPSVSNRLNLSAGAGSPESLALAVGGDAQPADDGEDGVCRSDLLQACSPQPPTGDREFKARSCGEPVTGTEIMIYKPDKMGIGEVCMRGRHVFMGYFKDDKQTR